MIVKGPEVTWYRPTTLEELLKLKLQFPQAKIIVGNTEVGVEVKFKHFVYPVLIQPSQVKEMHTVVKKKDSVIIGAAVTLTEMEDVLLDEIKTQPGNNHLLSNGVFLTFKLIFKKYFISQSTQRKFSTKSSRC